MREIEFCPRRNCPRVECERHMSHIPKDETFIVRPTSSGRYRDCEFYVAPILEPRGSRLNLNTATEEELRELDCLGPTKARRIVLIRVKSGGFKSVSELRYVPCLGAITYEKLRRLVYVEGENNDG